MRVQASIQFSCAATGRNLETQLSTETRNLVMFPTRQGADALPILRPAAALLGPDRIPSPGQ